MNKKEREESCMLKYKKKRRKGKRKREKWKKVEAKQARKADRERRILNEAEHMLKDRIERNTPAKSQVSENQAQASLQKRAGSALKNVDVPSAKVVRTPVLREIRSHHITISKQHLRSGSFAACYLGTYRNMTVEVFRKVFRNSAASAAARNLLINLSI